MAGPPKLCAMANFRWKGGTDRIYDDIRGFLTGSPDTQITVWQGYSVLLAFQAALLLLALLMLVATFLSRAMTAAPPVSDAPSGAGGNTR